MNKKWSRSTTHWRFPDPGLMLSFFPDFIFTCRCPDLSVIVREDTERCCKLDIGYQCRVKKEKQIERKKKETRRER